MHSPKCVTPLHPVAVRMKEFTSKRKKTEEDLLAISDLEWETGVYWDNNIGLHIPNECIKATIQNGAKQHKKGKDIAKYLQVATLMAPLNIGEEQNRIKSSCLRISPFVRLGIPSRKNGIFP